MPDEVVIPIALTDEQATLLSRIVDVNQQGRVYAVRRWAEPLEELFRLGLVGKTEEVDSIGSSQVPILIYTLTVRGRFSLEDWLREHVEEQVQEVQWPAYPGRIGCP